MSPYIIIILGIPLLYVIASLLGKYALYLYHHAYINHIELKFPSSLAKFNYVKAVLLPSIFIGTILYVTYRADFFDEWFGQYIIGLCTALVALSLGQNLATILIYYYAKKHPKCMEGKVIVKQELTSILIKIPSLHILPIVLITSVYLNDPFIWGCVITSIGLLLRPLYIILYR